MNSFLLLCSLFDISIVESTTIGIIIFLTYLFSPLCQGQTDYASLFVNFSMLFPICTSSTVSARVSVKQDAELTLTSTAEGMCKWQEIVRQFSAGFVFKHLSITVCVCELMCMQPSLSHSTHVRSEGGFRKSVFFFHPAGLGIELRLSSRVMASTSPCGSTS